MRKKISSAFIDALKKAIDECGSQSELSRRSGVGQATISAIINPKKKQKMILDSIFDQLYPFCSKFLPADSSDLIPQRPMRKDDFGKDAEAVPLERKKIREVPVLTFAQAAGFEPAVEPLCDYLRETSTRTQIFFDVPDTWFALEVHGDSMDPDYPNGSIALVAAGEFPERGDIVVAKLSTGQVVIKEYHRKNGVISLLSRNPNGQNFEWNIKEQPGFIVWMFPVVQVIISPRSQRHAKAMLPLQ